MNGGTFAVCQQTIFPSLLSDLTGLSLLSRFAFRSPTPALGPLGECNAPVTCVSERAYELFSEG
jgi:hypothetical protein